MAEINWTYKSAKWLKDIHDYFAHKKRLEIIKLFGTIAFDKNYNYKNERKR